MSGEPADGKGEYLVFGVVTLVLSSVLAILLLRR
jgi:hypothetical protein